MAEKSGRRRFWGWISRASRLQCFLLGLSATLIESNGKKAAFLAEVKRRLGIVNVTVLNQRMEDVASAFPFDFVTVRAVAQTDDLFDWSKKNLVDGGKLILWLGEDGVKRCLETKGWDWETPVSIPGSTGRYILAGSGTTLIDCSTWNSFPANFSGRVSRETSCKDRNLELTSHCCFGDRWLELLRLRIKKVELERQLPL